MIASKRENYVTRLYYGDSLASEQIIDNIIICHSKKAFLFLITQLLFEVHRECRRSLMELMCYDINYRD